MRTRVAIVYNEPIASRYHAAGEEAAELGVLSAVEVVHRALAETGYEVTRVPLLPPLEIAKNTLGKLSTDVVFNLFEGFPGYPETEAEIPALLESLGIPYTGCPSGALRLALDKAKTKILLKAAGIPSPDFQLLTPETVTLFQLGFPCIVKPCSEHASHGLSAKSVVHNPTELTEQVIRISQLFDSSALVEAFLDGPEYNATVMGNLECEMLPPSEITYSLPAGVPRILTFAAKWEPESEYYQGTRAVCPAPITPARREQIAEIAMTAFRLLECRSYARVDMRCDRAGCLHVMEVNPNPDVSPDTGAALQAEAAGMTYAQFTTKIVALAMEKKQP